MTDPPEEILTPEQHDILKSLVSGLTYKQIALRRHQNYHTIRGLAARARARLHADTPMQMIAFYMCYYGLRHAPPPLEETNAQDVD